MRNIFISFLGIVFLFTTVSSASAYNYRKVLGTTDQNLTIPPTVEGPGIFLPDSPFYFLDQFKQMVRLTAALTPEQKAKIRTQIAGERTAELRFMLAKGNQDGIQSTLQDMAENFKKAAEEVDNATFAGKDTTKLAKEVNDNIKAKQKVLDELNQLAEGEVKTWVESTVAGMTSAKIKVENSLNEADFNNEVEDDIEREIELSLNKTTQSGQQLEEALEDYILVATEAARKSIEARTRNVERYEQKVASREAVGKNTISTEAQKRNVERAKERLQKALETVNNYEKNLVAPDVEFEPTGVSYREEEVLSPKKEEAGKQEAPAKNNR